MGRHCESTSDFKVLGLKLESPGRLWYCQYVWTNFRYPLLWSWTARSPQHTHSEHPNTDTQQCRITRTGWMKTSIPQPCGIAKITKKAFCQRDRATLIAFTQIKHTTSMSIVNACFCASCQHAVREFATVKQKHQCRCPVAANGFVCTAQVEVVETTSRWRLLQIEWLKTASRRMMVFVFGSLWVFSQYLQCTIYNSFCSKKSANKNVLCVPANTRQGVCVYIYIRTRYMLTL